MHASGTELQDRIKNTTTTLSAVNKPATTPALLSATAIVDECLDRDQQQSNLIIYGLPEPTGSTPAERRSSDHVYYPRMVNSDRQHRN